MFGGLCCCFGWLAWVWCLLPLCGVSLYVVGLWSAALGWVAGAWMLGCEALAVWELGSASRCGVPTYVLIAAGSGWGRLSWCRAGPV